MLEGSVRKSGNKVRVTAQLIEAANGSHVWVERYDRELEDIFAVQDGITEAIVGAIAPEIDEAERRIAQRRPPESLDAWGRYQRGLAAYYSTTADGLTSAIRQFDEVNVLDPTFAPACASGADAGYRYMLYYGGETDALKDQAQDRARRAIALEPRNPLCLTSSADVQFLWPARPGDIQGQGSGRPELEFGHGELFPRILCSGAPGCARRRSPISTGR